MNARSVFRPCSPPRASTSRVNWPFPTPPTAGLQGMRAILSILKVTRAVWQPIRAAARAASQPEWPPPTTTTSYPRSRSARVTLRRLHDGGCKRGCLPPRPPTSNFPDSFRRRLHARQPLYDQYPTQVFPPNRLRWQSVRGYGARDG